MIIKIDRLSTLLFSRSGVSLCFEGKNLLARIHIIHIRVIQAGHHRSKSLLSPPNSFSPPLPFFSFVSSSLDVVFKMTFTWASSWRNRGRWCLRRRWWNRGRPTRSCNPRRWNSRYANACPRKRWSEFRQCLETNSKLKLFQINGNLKEDKYSKRIKRYLWSVWSRRCISWRTVPRNNRRNRACRRETWIAGQPGNCYSCYRWSSLCATARSCTLPHRWWWSINDKISFHLYLFIYFPRGRGNFPLRLNGTCILRKESHFVESPQLNAQFNIIENTRYGKSTLVLHLVALNASSGKLVLVARGAIDLLLARDEALSPDRVLAYHAAEALLVPLPGLVLHLLRTWKDAKKTRFSLKLSKIFPSNIDRNSTRCNCTRFQRREGKRNGIFERKGREFASHATLLNRVRRLACRARADSRWIFPRLGNKGRIFLLLLLLQSSRFET